MSRIFGNSYEGHLADAAQSWSHAISGVNRDNGQSEKNTDKDSDLSKSQDPKLDPPAPK